MYFCSLKKESVPHKEKIEEDEKRIDSIRRGQLNYC